MDKHPLINELADKEVQSKTRMIVFVSMIFIACVAAGCVHLYYDEPFITILQMCFFILLGSLFAGFMHKRNSIFGKMGTLRYTVSLATGIVATLSVFYIYKNNFELATIIYLGCSFLLPCIVMEAWQQFINIPAVPKQAWYYSTDLPQEPPFVYLENIPVQIKLIKENRKPRLVSSIAPVSLNIGMMFYYAMKEPADSHRPGSLFVNENGKSHGWIFYISRFGLWKKYLVPGDTLFDNRIKPKQVIVAKCVS